MKPPRRVIWSSNRKIVKIGVPGCRRVVVFKPYAKLHPGGLIVDRVDSALTLLDQGYVACSVIPNDYVRGDHRVVEELGSEDVLLADLTSSPP